MERDSPLPSPTAPQSTLECTVAFSVSVGPSGELTKFQKLSISNQAKVRHEMKCADRPGVLAPGKWTRFAIYSVYGLRNSVSFPIFMKTLRDKLALEISIASNTSRVLHTYQRARKGRYVPGATQRSTVRSAEYIHTQPPYSTYYVRNLRT